METERLLDDVGRRILRELQENPRLGYTELGRRVGLTGTGVAERVHRLEEAGIIAGYRLDVDTEKLGLPITVFIRLATTEVRSGRVEALVTNTPEILECYIVTGDDSYLMKAAVSSVQHLEAVISKLLTVGKPTTAIVLSTAIGHRIVEPPAPSRQRPEESQVSR